MYHPSIITVLLLVLNVSKGRTVGDHCRVNGQPGLCKQREDCPKTIEDFKNYNTQPKFCTFDFNLILVCCPEETITQSTTTEPNDVYEVVRDIFRREPQRKPKQIGERQNSIGRISEQKCNEYREYSVKRAGFIPLLVDPVPIVREIPVCDTVSQLIVGGEAAKLGEFPHMVALKYETGITWRCGGTLISEYFCVTAAHCIKTIDGVEPDTVRLGDLHLLRTDDGASPIDYAVNRTYVHPGYMTKHAYNDIALVQLRDPVKFTDNIRPACLWQGSSDSLTKAIATGFGKTAFLNEESSNKLLKVELSINSNEDCERFYVPGSSRKLNQGILESQICAGSSDRKDTCQGDSGGPLATVIKGNRCLHYLIGITSIGKYCGDSDPGVYTRVSSYIDWIESIVWP